MYRYDAYEALAGAGDMGLFWALYNRLPYEPKSAYRAEEMGGMEHFGWGNELHTLTTIAELLQQNTAVTQVAGTNKRPRKAPPMYRPTVKRESKPQTLDDVNWSFFR